MTPDSHSVEADLTPSTRVADQAKKPASDPASYKKRVLLITAGMTEQVVTETLYALAKQNGGDALPTEVHAVTTARGAERLRRAYLPPGPCRIQALQRDHGLRDIRFDETHIHVPLDEAGNPLEDIVDAAGNSATADLILSLVREFTGTADCALHVSVAGGRKTMGYYAGAAMQLLARAQDRLSHALVAPPFENLPTFYYPTPEPLWLQRPGGLPAVDAQTATVTLVDIPFIALRDGLPASLQSGRQSFAQTVKLAASAQRGPKLEINRELGTICANGTTVTLPPSLMTLLAFFAKRLEQGKPALVLAKSASALPPDQRAQAAEATAAYLALAEDIHHRRGQTDEGQGHLDRLKDSIQRSQVLCVGDLSPKITKLRAALEAGLGPGPAAVYSVVNRWAAPKPAEGSRGPSLGHPKAMAKDAAPTGKVSRKPNQANARYELALADPTAISFADEVSSDMAIAFPPKPGAARA